MRYATNCALPLNAPSPGRTNSSACCCALRPNRFVIWDSNSLPSHSSISGSFAEAETCNQFNKKVVGLEQTWAGVTLFFADGSRAQADAVIGADGVHSVVREILLGPEKPRFTGRVAYGTAYP